MKFRVVTDEEFTSDRNLDNHYNKHIVKEKQFQYSKEKYVERAIRSILNQSLEEIALVVRKEEFIRTPYIF